MSKIYTHGFALIVGVGADLPNTVNDAVGLANILKDPSRCAYPEQQVNLLSSQQATRKNILSTLEKLSQSTNSDSTVIVYFSGHGYRTSSSTGEFYYLMPYGYDLNLLYQTAINGNEFTEKLRAIPAKKLLVLLDCCHAGGVGDTKAPGLQLEKCPLPPEAEILLAKGSGRVFIASSRENELSYAGKPYSAFTLALIETLCGIGVAKNDGYVRVADLALHACEVVPQRTKDKQHPFLHFEEADNFVVAYYGGGDTQSKGLPFADKPEIEPSPGTQTVFDKRGETVGTQTNIAGGVNGTVVSGHISGSLEVGKQKTTYINGGFYQPGWKVNGDVTQIEGDYRKINTNGGNYNERIEGDYTEAQDSRENNQESITLDQVFTDLMECIKSLPADDLAVIKPIAEQARTQAIKIQQGDNNLETQNALEKRLRSLLTLRQDIGEEVITKLANSSMYIAKDIQKIAKRVQGNLKSE
jgi:Caspase domain